MSRIARSLMAVGAVLLSVIVMSPGGAMAGSGSSVTPSIQDTMTVGDTGVPVSISIRNSNTPDEDTISNTVCNTGDDFPCPATPALPVVPQDQDPGINVILSCGQANLNDICLPAGADPGVFAPSATATGAAGSECDGVVFDIEETDPTFGLLRLTPNDGSNVVIAPGLTCVIEFTVEVLKLPAVDFDPNTDGVQTLVIADNTQFTLGQQGALTNNGSGTDSTTIVKNTPIFSTNAGETNPGSSSDNLVGEVILTDTAFVVDRVSPDPSGTVSFRLYGPDDVDCSQPPVFEDLAVPMPIDVDEVTSSPFVPTLAGVYRWIGSYSGDLSNEAVSGECNDPNESSLVSTAGPVITTEASADIELGDGVLVDNATVTGRVLPLAGATVTFELYGPDDTACANAPIFTSVVPYPVDGGSVMSDPYTPTAVGTYQWVASYSGDANNSSATGLCGDELEITDVFPAAPEIVTDASENTSLGNELTDIARVIGLVNPIGSTIDFRLYGPDDADCSNTPVFTSLGIPYGPTDSFVSSEAFTPTFPGTYRWVASYNGDANNLPAVGVCGDPLETTVVDRAVSRIVTEASPGTTVGDGGALTDTAVVLDRFEPDSSGVVDFRLYGPNDANCSGAPVFTSLGIPYPAAGGPVTSAPFFPTMPGIYRWVATYRGDNNNAEAVGICGDPAETVSVFAEPDTTVELPATGQGGVGGTIALGLSSVVAGLALLGLGRRRRPALG